MPWNKLFAAMLPPPLSAGILVHYVCMFLYFCTYLCTRMCVGLLKYSCLGDSQTHFHVFEQSYDSFHTASLSVPFSLIFLILWTLDMDNSALWITIPSSSSLPPLLSLLSLLLSVTGFFFKDSPLYRQWCVLQFACMNFLSSVERCYINKLFIWCMLMDG